MFWVGRTKPIAKSTQRGNVYIFHIIMVYQDTIVPCIIRVRVSLLLPPPRCNDNLLHDSAYKFLCLGFHLYNRTLSIICLRNMYRQQTSPFHTPTTYTSVSVRMLVLTLSLFNVSKSSFFSFSGFLIPVVV